MTHAYKNKCQRSLTFIMTFKNNKIKQGFFSRDILYCILDALRQVIDATI